MPKENRLIAPRRYILLIAAIVAIFVFAAAHRDYFESSKVEFSHIRSFKKPNNQPTYLVLYNYLFEEENGNAIDFNLYGHQLRFYKTAQMSFQNAKVSGIITSKHIQMSIWLKKIDKMLFPWLKPQFPSTLALKESYVGSGIVICVSNNYIQSAMTTIAMIRVNSDMPIEFLYLSPSDLSEENIKLLESADHVKAKSIKTYFDTKTINIKGWEIKPFALLASSFKKAILIDARTVLLQPPENFFNNPMFLKTGALFFKERTVKSSDSKSAKKINSIVEKLLPKPISEDVTNMQILNRLSSHQQDSGVVVVDKDRVFAGLMATAFLNIDQTRQELSKYLIENKETFWLGFSTVKEDYSWSKHMPGVGGVSEKSNNGYYKVCGEQILHVDGNQSPLWMNDAGAKESNRFEREVKVFLLEPEVSGRNVGWESGAENTICVKSVIKPTALVLQEWLEKCRKVYANFQKSQKGTSSSAAATIPDRLSRRLEFNENAVPRVRQVKSVLELHQKNGPTAHLAR